LGITESRRGKGNFIRDSLNNLYIIQEIEELAKEADPIELLEARKAVETTITGIAATKAKEKDWLNLYKIFNDIKKDKNDISSIMKLDKKLHISIAKIADNSMLFAIMIFLTEGKNGKLWKKFEEKSWATPNRFEKYSKEHEKIIIAIKDNNKTKAEEAMNKHISGMKKDWFGFK
jgi:GntR family transcriptional repressor for pyruvate dehydrogenase complex